MNPNTRTPYHPNRSLLRNMPIHHGETPSSPEATWTTTTRNTGKKQPPQASTSESRTKTTEKDPPEGEIRKQATTIATPRHNESLYKTKINVTVRPTKDLEALSIPQSMTRIIATLQAADASARLITTDSTATRKNSSVPKAYHQTRKRTKNLLADTSKTSR